jgi:hypothetical protein
MLKKPEEIIRYIERTVLDSRFKQYMLVRRPRELAIPHLLKVFGHIEREVHNMNWVVLLFYTSERFCSPAFMQ